MALLDVKRETIEWGFFDNALNIQPTSVTVIGNKAQAVQLLGDKETANESSNQVMALELGYSI
jgi:hypothetical protein